MPAVSRAAPKDHMFLQNTSEVGVSDGFLRFRSLLVNLEGPKNIYLLRCLRGNFGRLESFIATPMGRVESSST